MVLPTSYDCPSLWLTLILWSSWCPINVNILWLSHILWLSDLMVVPKYRNFSSFNKCGRLMIVWPYDCPTLWLSDLHSSPKCWHDIFNANIYIQKCMFPHPVPKGHTETLQLSFIPQALKLYVGIEHIMPTLGGWMWVGEFLCALWAQGWGKYVSRKNIG